MECVLEQSLIFILALILDLTVGDPPEGVDRFYPIVWISRLMSFFDRRTKRGNPAKERALGILYTVLILVLFSLPCAALTLVRNEFARILISAVVLKMTFTVSGLERFATPVFKARSVEEKRRAVQKIVSRRVEGLDESHLNSAAIESVAENLTDSVVAPFFYFSILSAFGLGVAGAMAYRVVNTLDAVVGYKNRKYRHFGWFAARADDFLNFIPERIAAYLILLVGKASWAKGRRKLAAKGQNENTQVPLTISAMSSVLCVRLEKVGHYTVGEEFSFPRSTHISDAVRVVKHASFVSAALMLAMLTLVATIF
ncbi:MAG: adenosylcobinamide-phosphate synthase CbiB [Candidatus Methanospirare jalkutatii]|nr:adenosylcobinamide-phosphate synthase CbiB [Candidatus Methanospirare jalkutatii]